MKYAILTVLITVLATSCGSTATPSASTHAQTVSSSGPDTQAPTVSMMMHPATLREEGNVFFQLATRDNVGVSRVVINIDGQKFVDDSTSYNSYAKYFKGASNGEHTVTVRVYDLAQNVSEQTQTFTVAIGQ
ncbi:hypothetical protein LAJ19_12835 [Deinococcus taeanensis]|uniref:Ig-like domain-containing protein n=1 Tax=Deinococcus taeanensis TaxID=2737050 RepID=UPI001CDB586D|nr:Ig-like domain-containing protein [Deinococcus taeanensis]UBV42495.1 hypothetical protein LAJ19_12835 [Deinococcus taeanensis]